MSPNKFRLKVVFIERATGLTSTLSWAANNPAEVK